jgi:hypothetical protein
VRREGIETVKEIYCVSELIASTDDRHINAVLQGVVSIFEMTFPGRIAGYYVTGSWSNGAAVSATSNPANASDIDLHVVFKGTLDSSERERFLGYLNACQLISSVGLDVYAEGEDNLTGYWDVCLKQNSLLIYGQDIRDKITLPTVEDHLLRAMTYPPYDMATVRGQDTFAQEPRLVYPLNYPNANDRFYGYASPSTRYIVSIAAWSATILLALKAQRIAGTKRDAVQMYRQFVGDAWSDLITDVFTHCKMDWYYQVPPSVDEQRRLRCLCEQMLSLENYLLNIYKEYLTAALQQEEKIGSRQERYA